ncbi:stalk domain-containing protein [Lysinibacillus antri]|uniref:Copper amine oxidase N-terminal domain-containing protein n=1 Tax=Lysinibacillus antri TaxID=2498145 RepID=A0A432LEN9_9BACI|nr:stalk domain-containing protein [Lysinibacillus antri]RUL55529.1 copper amine oxidase N-terminal domain-containing protein [Lysinibacillus antri]
MKKTTALLLATTMVGSIMLTPVAKAENVEVISVEESEKEVGNVNFISVTGTITKITEESTGNFFATIKNEDEEFGFYFNDETRIFDNTGKVTELKEGLKFTAFVDARKPMILIYPPRYSPEVIIVQTEEAGTVALEQFDEKFLNKKKDTVINISDDTVIEDLSGKSLKKEAIVDKDVLIFYEVVLESYPMQIGPSKIIVLEKEPTAIEKAYAIVEKDFYEVNGEMMIPLRLVAETLGYKVDSTGTGAIVSKGNVSFTITRGTTIYGYNKALRQFKETPELLEQYKTYVPYEFLQLLVEHVN